MINLTVTDLNEFNILLAGLGELPAKMSYPLIKKLEEQYTMQTKDAHGPTTPSLQEYRRPQQHDNVASGRNMDIASED